jgi:hypothetical protein
MHVPVIALVNHLQFRRMQEELLIHWQEIDACKSSSASPSTELPVLPTNKENKLVSWNEVALLLYFVFRVLPKA